MISLSDLIKGTGERSFDYRLRRCSSARSVELPKENIAPRLVTSGETKSSSRNRSVRSLLLISWEAIEASLDGCVRGNLTRAQKESDFEKKSEPISEILRKIGIEFEEFNSITVTHGKRTVANIFFKMISERLTAEQRDVFYSKIKSLDSNREKTSDSFMTNSNEILVGQNTDSHDSSDVSGGMVNVTFYDLIRRNIEMGGLDTELDPKVLEMDELLTLDVELDEVWRHLGQTNSSSSCYTKATNYLLEVKLEITCRKVASECAKNCNLEEKKIDFGTLSELLSSAFGFDVPFYESEEALSNTVFIINNLAQLGDYLLQEIFKAVPDRSLENLQTSAERAVKIRDRTGAPMCSRWNDINKWVPNIGVLRMWKFHNHLKEYVSCVNELIDYESLKMESRMANMIALCSVAQPVFSLRNLINGRDAGNGNLKLFEEKKAELREYFARQFTSKDFRFNSMWWREQHKKSLKILFDLHGVRLPALDEAMDEQGLIAWSREM